VIVLKIAPTQVRPHENLKIRFLVAYSTQLLKRSLRTIVLPQAASAREFKNTVLSSLQYATAETFASYNCPNAGASAQEFKNTVLSSLQYSTAETFVFTIAPTQLVNRKALY
jgi:hypothetical protein